MIISRLSSEVYTKANKNFILKKILNGKNLKSKEKVTFVDVQRDRG